jgi:hypothetical protein
MSNNELKFLILRLRELTLEYRLTENDNISNHISSVEIALNLTEMYLDEKRNILKSERIWFDACYNLSYTFSSDSKWSEVVNLYCSLSDEMHLRKFY